MRGRIRILLALAFAAAFVLVPEPDAQKGRPYLGYLLVRDWLLGRDSPLASWDQQGPPPRLEVELHTSPPIPDDGERQRRRAELSRLADEWLLANQRTPAPEAARPTLAMIVHVGERGVRAAIAAPDGTELRIERAFPSRVSLLPALLAIVIAVLTQRVLPALLVGGLAGAMAWVATHDLLQTPGAFAVAGQGVAHFFGDALWRRSIGEDFYLRITAFVVFLFMTIGIITRNGGVHGLVRRLQRIVRGPTSAQAGTVLTGMAVFFDDYTNCLLVGTTMRPLTDKARVAREKLAYLVDSTAAPIAGLSVFSTWVVYEMSQYRAPLTMVTRPDGSPYLASDTFSVFLDSLPFRFYSIFALTLVVLVVLLRRDYGPMLRAERRARHLGQPLSPGVQAMAAVDEQVASPDDDTPRRARNAVVPLVVLVLGTVALMLGRGYAEIADRGDLAQMSTGTFLREVLAHAHSDTALLYASISAWVVAIALSLGQRLLSPRTILATSLRSTRALYVAFGILFLAWSLGHICRDLGTSYFLTAAARDAMTAAALPVLLFAVAGAIAFATGTSFGTMAILLPNVVVLAHQLGTDAAFGGDARTGGPALMLISIGAVLEGAIFGDHCSPISDTTVLSSLGAQCDLLAHVSTQLPYALLAMATSAICGYLPVVWFGPEVWPFSLLAGGLVLATTLLVFGRDPARPPPPARPAPGCR
ncbi:MAG TPA: Na+/H+ antiporter NhaC family protein [bacterium]|nr:Na+/H+ antiporter NhaC family protein [bacterium]